MAVGNGKSTKEKENASSTSVEKNNQNLANNENFIIQWLTENLKEGKLHGGRRWIIMLLSGESSDVFLSFPFLSFAIFLVR